MKDKKKSNGLFDPNGNYTGKFIKEFDEQEIIALTPPEQDADDL